MPPPPSSPPPPPHGEKPALEFQSKANLDAQMVLRGAIAFGKYDVTHDVVDSLAGAKVTPSFDTFLLMIEAMIASNDLPQASEYLMKMEQEGHSPDAMLLDRVMDLCSIAQPAPLHGCLSCPPPSRKPLHRRRTLLVVVEPYYPV